MQLKSASSKSGRPNNGRPRLKISTDQSLNTELQWSPREKKKLAERITKLRTEQIAALLQIAGVIFRPSEIEAVASEIRLDGLASGHLEILMAEADSKASLLWWLGFFERHVN